MRYFLFSFSQIILIFSDVFERKSCFTEITFLMFRDEMMVMFQITQIPIKCFIKHEMKIMFYIT